MQWRNKLKGFGVRFAICLVVLGAAYLLIFGFKLTSHNKPNTPSAKVLALRAALDQTYIDSTILAKFKQNDTVSYSTLSELIGHFESDVKSLKTALGKAPKQLSPDIRKQIDGVLTSEEQVIADFGARYNILLRPLSYDPTSDLGALDPTKDETKLAQRATAAQAGLKKAANDSTTNNSANTLGVGTVGGASSLITDSLRQSLSTEADCFGKIVAQLNAHQTTEASQTRSSCIKAYPALRLGAIQNVAQGSFSDNYMTTFKKTVIPLLEQLNTAAANMVQKPSK